MKVLSTIQIQVTDFQLSEKQISQLAFQEACHVTYQQKWVNTSLVKEAEVNSIIFPNTRIHIFSIVELVKKRNSSSN